MLDRLKMAFWPFSTPNLKAVTVLEDVYYRLLPLISNHPNWNHWLQAPKMRCPNCGGPFYFKPGEYHYTKRAVNPLGHCLKCGKWDIDPRPVRKRDL